MNIEHGTFTPLIFALNGGVGTECSIFHKHLAERIASKTKEKYDSVLNWIRCKISFMFLRARFLCIRGSRLFNNGNNNNNIAVVDDFNWLVTMLVYYKSLVLSSS